MASRKSKRLNWIRVPQPATLLDEVEQIIKEHPELGYTGIAEFCRDATREKIERIKAPKQEIPVQ